MKKLFLAATVLVCFPLYAQQAPTVHTSSAWETNAGGHQEFDVVSIHRNKNPDDPQFINVPYGPEDNYTNTGGVFRTTNIPVFRLISFAYKLTTAQAETFRASVPDWGFTEGFTIEARTDNQNATKDQLRLMVRSMLEERFLLKIRYETRMVSAYAVQLVKPGELGPQLRPHPQDDSCSGGNAAVRARPHADSDAGPPPPSATPAAPGLQVNGYPVVAGGFPRSCGTFANMPPSQPYMRHEGGRDLTMAQIVSTFTGMGNLGRPAVDRTGLTGTFDWVMEFIDERDGHTPPPDAEGLHFEQALAKQNGLKLVATKAPIEFVLVEHVERPTEN